jgi:hypothetical protein
MTHEPITGGQAAALPPAPVLPLRTPLSRRELITRMLVGLLLPVSILTALVVLYVMSSASAAATGGCGGG